MASLRVWLRWGLFSALIRGICSQDGAVSNAGDVSQYYPSDPLQLLFGKYQDWNNIRPIHYIIFAISLTSAVLIYVRFLIWRTIKYNRKQVSFPSTKWMEKEFHELKTMPTYIEIEETIKKIKRSVLLPEDVGQGNPAWSKWPMRNLELSIENTKLEHIHFNKIVAESYLLIERLVVRRLPYLRSSRDRTVRDYIWKVTKEFELDIHDVNKYLRLYERARFGAGRKLAHKRSGKYHHKATYQHKATGKASTPDEVYMRQIFDAKGFLSFLKCLNKIMEKIRVGFRLDTGSGGREAHVHAAPTKTVMTRMQQHAPSAARMSSMPY